MITTHRLPRRPRTPEFDRAESNTRSSEPLPAVVPVDLRLSRLLEHPPARVFAAYADIERRSQWRPPPDEVVEFRSHDFRQGGTDHFFEQPPSMPSVEGITFYEQIDPYSRIVFTERYFDSDERPIAISIVTWTMDRCGAGTQLMITDQTTSIVGSGPIEGSRHACDTMLDRLAQHLAQV